MSEHSLREPYYGKKRFKMHCESADAQRTMSVENLEFLRLRL